MHKANVIKQSDGLFLEAAREVAREAAEHPEIEFDDRRVDSLCCELAMRPGDFDVLVMPLFYGDFVSDLGAGLVGRARDGARREPRRRLRDLRGRCTARPRSTRGANRVEPVRAACSPA